MGSSKSRGDVAFLSRPVTSPRNGFCHFGNWCRAQVEAGLRITSFRLRLAAEGRAAKTIRTYTEAVQWFAAASLLPAARTALEQALRAAHRY